MESDKTMRECPWCNEQVRVRVDGRLAFHRWEVGWDRDRDKPIMGRCVGSATTLDDAIQAGWRPDYRAPVIDSPAAR
jgi:hypothetical protein